MSALEARELCVERGGQRVLERVSLRLEPGRLCAVVGPNGAGKSTLLLALAGDLTPCAGWVGIDGRPLRALGDREQARRRAVMAQFAPAAFEFSALEIAQLGWLDELRPAPPLAAQIELQTLAACGVGALAARSYPTLSGGERQRVQLARALLQLWRPEPAPPRYLLLDEPTASLDLRHAVAVLEGVRVRLGPELGALVVLHDLNLAARFADEVLLLERGRTAAQGPADAVLSAAELSRVYGVPVHVEYCAALGRRVVLH